jgi:hypothetical protein
LVNVHTCGQEHVECKRRDTSGSESGIQLIGGLAALVAVAAAYYMPSIIAARRKHQREKSIAALNLLLGWTGVGWCAALAWAMLGAGRPTTPPEK